MECSVQGFPPNVANVLLSVAVRWCDFSRAHQRVWFHSFLVFCFDVHTLCHNYMGRNHHSGHTNSLQWELMCQYDYVNRWLIAYAVLFQVCAVCVCHMVWSVCCFKCLYSFCSAVPSVAPPELTAIPLGPHSLQLSWKPLAEEEARGELVNYTVRYHRKHHGHRPKFVHIQPNRYGLCKLSKVCHFNRGVTY